MPGGQSELFWQVPARLTVRSAQTKPPFGNPPTTSSRHSPAVAQLQIESWVGQADDNVVVVVLVVVVVGVSHAAAPFRRHAFMIALRHARARSANSSHVCAQAAIRSVHASRHARRPASAEIGTKRMISSITRTITSDGFER